MHKCVRIWDVFHTISPKVDLTLQLKVIFSELFLLDSGPTHRVDIWLLSILGSLLCVPYKHLFFFFALWTNWETGTGTNHLLKYQLYCWWCWAGRYGLDLSPQWGSMVSAPGHGSWDPKKGAAGEKNTYPSSCKGTVLGLRHERGRHPLLARIQALTQACWLRVRHTHTLFSTPLILLRQC